METAKEEDYTPTGMTILGWYNEEAKAQPYTPKLVALAKRIYGWLQREDQDLAKYYHPAARAFVAICWGPHGEEALRRHYRGDERLQIALRNNISRKLSFIGTARLKSFMEEYICEPERAISEDLCSIFTSLSEDFFLNDWHS